jgi:predicted RNA-binding protein
VSPSFGALLGLEKGQSMSKYWIFSMVEENYLIAMRLGLIGLSNRAKRVIEQIAIDDMATFYIGKKKMDSPLNDLTQRVQQYRGIARVSSAPFESNEIVWPVSGAKIFPYRVKVQFLSDLKVDAKPLAEKLSFTRNMLYWALPFQKGYEEILSKDFEVIRAAMEKIKS